MFTSGTFTPAPARASVRSMLLAQASIEAKLFLRHGEQQLLSLVIPVAMLIGLTLVPVLPQDDPIGDVFPFALGVAGMSAGFTGQAIAVAFDRRYGALKRIGASGVPSWTIIGGKILAVLGVALFQTVILGTVAAILGFRTSLLGVGLGLLGVIVGVATFTALGLLLGGTLGSEIVLASANLIWFVLIGAAGYATFRGDSPWLDWVPSVAVVKALAVGFSGTVPWVFLFVLFVWLIIGGLAAVRSFRFTA